MMRKFTAFLALFLFPIVFIGVLTEILIRKIPNDYNYKKNYLDQHAKELKVLFLGSSHAYYGINPSYIQSSFNAGHVSQSLDYDFEILKKYKDSWANLQYIVIPIDYFSLYIRLENGTDSWRAKNYKIYYDVYRDHQVFNHAELLTNKLEVNLRRLYGYYLKNRNDIHCNQLGWGVDYSSKVHRDLEKSGNVAAARHSVKSDAHLAENIALLNEMISFATHRNIRVILFTSPAYQSYVSHLNKVQLNKTLSVAHLMSKLHPKTRYFNLLQDTSFHKSDFYDGDHLNEIGAKKLSLKMRNWL